MKSRPRLSVTSACTANKVPSGIALILVAAIGVFLSASATAAPASEWSPEVADALQTYRDGDYVSARALAERVLAHTRDPQVRVDAAAVRAMTLLQGPSRADREMGKAEIGQLYREHPDLADRPECNLALGMAHSALAETGAGLALLDAAVEGFAARGENDRLAAALVALAETWARHNEWEVTPARFGVSKPHDGAQARKIRRDRIARIRLRVAALPDSAASVARIDLITAEDLLQDADSAAAGVQMLERLAAGPEMTPAVTAALTALAGRYEAERRWQEAAALYERLAREADKVAAESARQKLAAITRPQLRLDVPATVPTNRAVKLELGARNIAAIQVEVRKLDLQAWLAARQGRLSEALLPIAGSVQFLKRIETPAAQPHDWWESAAAHSPEFDAPAGAYVVLVQAADQSGVEPLKRLLIVSDLAAVAWVGAQQAVIWAGGNPQNAAAAGWNPADLAADFWMCGSFVPTQPQFTAGIARMDLPPEARLLRDHHWICLVHAGEHLALCRGELPQERAAGPQVAFTGGPAKPQPGDTLTLAGLVLNEAAQRQNTPRVWQLEIRNVLDEDLGTVALEPSAAGMFSVELSVPESWSGEHLHFIVRRDQQVAENLAPRLMVQVANAGREDFVVCPATPPDWPSDADHFVARINAWLPWGAPAGLGQFASVLRAVRLPDETNGFQSVPSDALELPNPHGQPKVTQRRPGQFEFSLPLEVFGLPPGPTACGLWVTFSGWNGQQTGTLSEILRDAEPVHAWLQSEPAEPTAGQPIQLHLGWFDPTRRTGLTPASAVIRRDGEAAGELEFSVQADGSQSACWQAPQPGEYQIEAHIPRLDEPPVAAHRRVSVQPGIEGAPQALQATCGTGFQPVKTQSDVRVAAEFIGGEQPGAVRVRLEGELEQPFIVLIAGDEPVAAEVFDRLDGLRECSLAAPQNAWGLQVHVVSLKASGPVTLAAGEVSVAPSQRLQLDLTPGRVLLPGQHVALPFAVRTAAGSAAHASVLAQLRPVLSSGTIEWMPGPPAADSHPAPAPGPRPAASWSVNAAASEPVTSASAAPLGLLKGDTLWTACYAATEQRLEFTLPQTPGLYRLSTIARDTQGTLAEKDVLLDTRAGLRLFPDAPARCSLGDRFVIGLAAHNPHAVPITADVRVDPGAGLNIESLQIIDSPEASNPAEDAQSLAREVVVPPNGVIWLQAHVEAVQAGRWDLKMAATVRAATVEKQSAIAVDGSSAPVLPEPGDVQEASVHYVVVADAAPSAAGPAGRPLQIKRTLLLLEKDKTPVGDQAEDFGARHARQSQWQRYVLPPDARLEPGQRILVRESFTVAQPAAALKWSQRIPPNCSFAAKPESKPNAVGTLETPRADELDFRTRGLPAGPHEHEYELIATRPGVCVLPLPEIWISGQRVEAASEPAELRLNVIGAAKP